MTRLIAMVVIAALLAAEAFARWGLGLGTPPLSISHPTIEYMFRPNQDLYRFHNHQHFNEYGMRSPQLTARNYDRLVLAFGDSVLNGGNLTDQDDLATTLASSALSTDGSRVVVGNVSAGSWGPGNIRAWIEHFGFLGADTVVLVLSSHDLADTPTFSALDPNTHPTRQPVSALVEALQRYLPRYLSFMRPPQPNRPPASAAQIAAAEAEGAHDIDIILDRAQRANVRVCAVQHLTKSELAGAPQRGYAAIGALLDRRGVPRVSDADQLRAQLNSDPPPYRDDIHISAVGQASLASALLECVRIAKQPTPP